MKGTTWTRLAARLAAMETKADALPDEHGFRAAMTIEQLIALQRAIEAEIDQEIIRAREQGHTWSGLYRGSKQAAQQRWKAAMGRTPEGRRARARAAAGR